MRPAPSDARRPQRAGTSLDECAHDLEVGDPSPRTEDVVNATVSKKIRSAAPIARVFTHIGAASAVQACGRVGWGWRT